MIEMILMYTMTMHKRSKSFFDQPCWCLLRHMAARYEYLWLHPFRTWGSESRGEDNRGKGVNNLIRVSFFKISFPQKSGCWSSKKRNFFASLSYYYLVIHQDSVVRLVVLQAQCSRHYICLKAFFKLPQRFSCVMEIPLKLDLLLKITKAPRL